MHKRQAVDLLFRLVGVVGFEPRTSAVTLLCWSVRTPAVRESYPVSSASARRSAATVKIR